VSSPLDAFRLDGKVAIVTGASRGLGRAIALALAGAGADVAVAARSRPDLEETARQIEALGRRALAVPTDVAEYMEVEALVEHTAATLGRLDIVVNNSGIAQVTPLAEMAPEDFRRTVDVNLVGVWNGCRAAAARLIAQRAGKVINLASVLGATGLPGYSAYAASKGGVMALTRALAVEWARHDVQVNAIAPGWFVTDMNAEAFDNPKVRERLLRDVPARRTGRLEEIGPLVVFLASRASDYMTGQIVFLDGGHSAG
jgi:2-deoxy-D-gluconate 3-dehydrogenase